MATPWEIVSIAGTAVVFLYSYYRKSYLTAYFIGIVFGLFWEISAEPLFNYSQQAFGIFIWKDVPLAIILGWGCSIAVFQRASDFVHKKYKIKTNTKNSIFCDAAVAGILGIAMEYIGSHNFALWTYPPTSLPMVAGMPIVWPIGWFTMSLAYLSLARRIDNLGK